MAEDLNSGSEFFDCGAIGGGSCLAVTRKGENNSALEGKRFTTPSELDVAISDSVNIAGKASQSWEGVYFMQGNKFAVSDCF